MSGMNLPVTRGVSLRQQVYLALQDLILTGELAPGEHLPEVELSERLGVSRQPVREALHQLAIDGWIDRVEGKGAFVHLPTRKEIGDLFAVRTILEAEAVALACDLATDHDHAVLAALLERGFQAVSDRDTEAVVAANTEFHVWLANAARNDFLKALIETVSLRVAWVFRNVALVRGQQSWHEHAEIADAIRAHDRTRAVELLKSHTNRTREALERAEPS